MKKLLSILGAVVIAGSATTSVIACDSTPSSNDEHTQDEIIYNVNALINRGLTFDYADYLSINEKTLNEKISNQIGITKDNDLKEYSVVAAGSTALTPISYVKNGQFNKGAYQFKIARKTGSGTTFVKSNGNDSFKVVFDDTNTHAQSINWTGYDALANSKVTTNSIDFSNGDIWNVGIFKGLIEGIIGPNMDNWKKAINNSALDPDIKKAAIAALDQYTVIYNVPLKTVLDVIWEVAKKPIIDLLTAAGGVKNLSLTSDGKIDSANQKIVDAINASIIKVIQIFLPTYTTADFEKTIPVSININGFALTFNVMPSNISGAILPDLAALATFVNSNPDLFKTNTIFGVLKFFLSNRDLSTTKINNSPSINVVTNLDSLVFDIIGNVIISKNVASDTGWQYQAGASNYIGYQNPALQNISLGGVFKIDWSFLTDKLKVKNISEVLTGMLSKFMNVADVTKDVPLSIAGLLNVNVKESDVWNPAVTEFFAQKGLDMSKFDVHLTAGNSYLETYNGTKWTMVPPGQTDFSKMTAADVTNIHFRLSHAKFEIIGKDSNSNPSVYRTYGADMNFDLIAPLFF